MVISIAYRLGVYGFLPVTPETTQGGNFGLIDQQNALIWGNKFAPLGEYALLVEILGRPANDR